MIRAFGRGGQWADVTLERNAVVSQAVEALPSEGSDPVIQIERLGKENGKGRKLALR